MRHVHRRWGLAGLAVVLTFGATAMFASPAVAAPGPAQAPEWWFDTWSAPSLWAQGADGRGIVIAEIDSGINAALPELAGRILPGTDFGPSGGDGRTDRDIDPFGHGTAMASIMVSAPGRAGIEGLAPAAKILPIAVPLKGTDDAGADDHLAQAIRYSADHGAKIINMSIGASRDPVSDPDPCPADEQAAIAYAAAKGAILVTADGNGGMSGNPVEEPGVCVGVVAVGAIDSAYNVPAFSSRHPYVTVVAPGSDVPSLGRIPGMPFHGNGTSQATAITSAALALIWSKFPTLTNRQILARLLATLDNPHATRDPAYGFGAINPEKAITADVAAARPDPIFSALDPYVAVQQAASAKQAVPEKAKTAAQPRGGYAPGSVPGRFTGSVVLSMLLAAAGLIALAVLIGIGWTRRRESETRNAIGPPPPGSPVIPTRGVYTANYIDWQEVVPAPREWAPSVANQPAGELPGVSEPPKVEGPP